VIAVPNGIGVAAGLAGLAPPLATPLTTGVAAELAAGPATGLAAGLTTGLAAQPVAGLLCAAALAACVWLLSARGRRSAGGVRRPGRARRDPGRGNDAPAGAPRQGTAVPAVPAVPAEHVPLVCDTLAALLESGMSLEQALVAAGSAEGPAPGLAAVGARLTWGSGWEQAWASCPGSSLLAAPLWLSFRTGAPASALLSDAATEARRRVARELETQAAAMTVRLVLPLGLCALPAFVCLGIVPVALALLPWL
jgi:hypothetical protein